MLLRPGVRGGFLEEGKFKPGLKGMGAKSSAEERKGIPGGGAPSMKALSSRRAGVGSRNCKLVPGVEWKVLVGKGRVPSCRDLPGRGCGPCCSLGRRSVYLHEPRFSTVNTVAPAGQPES